VQSTSIKVFFFLQKLEQYVFFWFYFFSATPHYYDFFAVHTTFLWQPNNIIRCKQAQQNNCRLAHSRLLPFFCNAHGNHVATKEHPTLQTSATICSSGNLPDNEVFFCNRTRDLCLQQDPTFANFRNHQNFFQHSTKTLTMKPQIIPDLWVLQPEVANQQQTK
jgi:hypothetical protein